MGLVYVPQSAGKGATSGNLKRFNPRLAGAYSRTGAIIQGLQFGYRFVRANYKLFTGIGAVTTGAGVENLIGQSDNQFGETLRTGRFQQRSTRNGSTKFNRRRKARPIICKSCACGVYNKSRIRRNVGYRK